LRDDNLVSLYRQDVLGSRHKAADLLSQCRISQGECGAVGFELMPRKAQPLPLQGGRWWF
jgi:hypothetical protein